MNRQERRRERLISLTQTEIMFVLAAVILLLLFAKIDDLAKTEKDLQEAKNEIASMNVVNKGDDGAGIINKIITAGKIDPEASDVAKQVSATLDAMIARNQQLQEVDNVLTEVKTKENESQSKESGKEKESRMEKLRKAVKDANAFNKAQSESGADSESSEQSETKPEKPGTQDSEQGQPSEKSDEYYASVGKAVIDELGKGVLSPQEVKDSITELQVGFIPCWRGTGKRRFYFAYHIAYDSKAKRYEVSLHKDTLLTVSVVQSALSGALGEKLLDYPKGPITAEKLEEFGKEIQQTKNEVYRDNPSCKLAATVTRNFGSDLVEFTRDDVGIEARWLPPHRSKK